MFLVSAFKWEVLRSSFIKEMNKNPYPFMIMEIDFLVFVGKPIYTLNIIAFEVLLNDATYH